MPDVLTPQVAAELKRRAHGAYDDVDDAVLVKAVTEKRPDIMADVMKTVRQIQPPTAAELLTGKPESALQRSPLGEWMAGLAHPQTTGQMLGLMLPTNVPPIWSAIKDAGATVKAGYRDAASARKVPGAILKQAYDRAFPVTKASTAEANAMLGRTGAPPTNVAPPLRPPSRDFFDAFKETPPPTVQEARSADLMLGRTGSPPTNVGTPPPTGTRDLYETFKAKPPAAATTPPPAAAAPPVSALSAEAKQMYAALEQKFGKGVADTWLAKTGGQMGKAAAAPTPSAPVTASRPPLLTPEAPPAAAVTPPSAAAPVPSSGLPPPKPNVSAETFARLRDIKAGLTKPEAAPEAVGQLRDMIGAERAGRTLNLPGDRLGQMAGVRQAAGGPSQLPTHVRTRIALDVSQLKTPEEAAAYLAKAKDAKAIAYIQGLFQRRGLQK